MGNARLDEAQAGIKIAGRNINNLRYADDTTLMADSEESKNRKRYVPIVWNPRFLRRLLLQFAILFIHEENV